MSRQRVRRGKKLTVNLEGRRRVSVEREEGGGIRKLARRSGERKSLMSPKQEDKPERSRV
jgi:hypothetical protein